MVARSESARVKRIIDFIEALTVPSGKGEGGPFKLRPFQRKFIRDVYGAVDKGGNRRVRRAILSIGRKNGKTALIAALVLTHLIGPEAVTNGEIYSAANEREQAGIVFKYAAQIVRADPELESLIKIVDSTKRMICFSNGSFYHAVSAEAGTKYGLNPTVVIYDELAQAKKTDLYDALDTSMAARLEPLMIVISTQSNDPQHILSQLIDDGLSGHDASIITHLYAVPDDAENIFDDEKLWKLANPALGDFRSLAEMRDYAKMAKRLPTREAPFRNLYLNQRVDAESPLIPRSEWTGCRAKDGEVIKDGDEIYLGLDLSGSTDLTALIAVSAGNDDRTKAWFWKPEDCIRDHEARDRVPYSVWVSGGYIETPPGRSIQYEWVVEQLIRIYHQYKVLGMAYDRYRINDLINAANRQGLETYIENKDHERIDALRLVPWGQGFVDMAPAIDAFEISVLERKLKHDGNPVLTWNVSNAMVKPDEAGNRKIDKSRTRFRIDGAVALAMALGLKARDLMADPGPSVYEERGVMTL